LPQSAINTRCIDFVLGREEIAKQIVRIAFGNPSLQGDE